MTRTFLRWTLIGVVVLVGGATALAQRGGGFNGFGLSRQSYSANNKYDGQFTFTRVSYVDHTPDRQGGHWAHDYPTGERHFTRILKDITNLDTRVDSSNVISLSDPDIFKFPVIYMSEPGYWPPTDEDVTNLRAYLLKGGFIIFDDFGDVGRNRQRGQWANLDLQMSRVFPELRWIDLDDDAQHPIFHSFFEINNPRDIPNSYDPGPPIFRALFQDNDETKRMLAFANYNADISEFWEYSETGMFAVDATNWAYKVGVNEFVYGITH